jgi:hypothetical protein
MEVAMGKGKIHFGFGTQMRQDHTVYSPATGKKKRLFPQKRELFRYMLLEFH